MRASKRCDFFLIFETAPGTRQRIDDDLRRVIVMVGVVRDGCRIGRDSVGSRILVPMGREKRKDGERDRGGDPRDDRTGDRQAVG